MPTSPNPRPSSPTPGTARGLWEGGSELQSCLEGGGWDAHPTLGVSIHRQPPPPGTPLWLCTHCLHRMCTAPPANPLCCALSPDLPQLCQNPPTKSPLCLLLAGFQPACLRDPRSFQPPPHYRAAKKQEKAPEHSQQHSSILRGFGAGSTSQLPGGVLSARGGRACVCALGR